MSVAKSGVGLHELLEKSESEAASLRAELTALRQRNAELEAQCAAMRSQIEHALKVLKNYPWPYAVSPRPLLEHALKTNIGTHLLDREKEARWLIERSRCNMALSAGKPEEWSERKSAYLKEVL